MGWDTGLPYLLDGSFFSTFFILLLIFFSFRLLNTPFFLLSSIRFLLPLVRTGGRSGRVLCIAGAGASCSLGPGGFEATGLLG